MGAGAAGLWWLTRAATAAVETPSALPDPAAVAVAPAEPPAPPSRRAEPLPQAGDPADPVPEVPVPAPLSVDAAPGAGEPVRLPTAPVVPPTTAIPAANPTPPADPPAPKAEEKPPSARPKAAPAGGDARLTAERLGALKGATVFVKADAGRFGMTGSGFLMRLDGRTGLVVTNDHVVTPPASLRLRPKISLVFGSGTKNEKVLPAHVLATDGDRDLAVLKVEDVPDSFRPIDITREVEPIETMTVWVLGFPFGEALSVTRGNPAITVGKGTVSSIRLDERDEAAVVQIDGDLNPGNSGGPIVDGDGRLVGVAVARIVGTRIGLAIPPGELTKMLDGRVGAVGIRHRVVEDGSADVTAEAALIDPTNKIRSFGIHYVRADAPPAGYRRGADGVWPPLPGGTKYDLKLDGQKASGTFRLSGTDKVPVTYSFQAVYVNGAGKTVTTAPSKFRVTFAKDAVAAAPPSRGAPPPASVRPPRLNEPGPAARATNESLLGTASTTGGLTVMESKLPAKDVLTCLCWADGGKAFHALESNGVLRRVEMGQFKEELRLDVGARASWLSPSAEGLVLSVSDLQEVWLLDAKTFKVKARMDAPSVKRTLSAPALSYAYAVNHQGDSLHVLDLKTGATVRQYGARDFDVRGGVGFGSPLLTPDGKYLLTVRDRQLARFRVDGKDVTFEEIGPWIIEGRFDGPSLSGDGTLICAPSGGGNNRGLKDHPEIESYSTYVYPVTNLNRPSFALRQGAYPLAVGFDAKAGLVYTQNHEFELIVFTDKGLKLKEYRLSCGEPRQYLVHPAGRRLLLLAGAKLLDVELPAKE